MVFPSHRGSPSHYNKGMASLASQKFSFAPLQAVAHFSIERSSDNMECHLDPFLSHVMWSTEDHAWITELPQAWGKMRKWYIKELFLAFLKVLEPLLLRGRAL